MPIAEGARRVRGSGPSPAKIAFFGEAPGKLENFRGIPFVGKAGAVLRTFAEWHRIPLDHCWVSNVCQYWPGRGRDGKDLKPDTADLARDEPVVLRELALVKPEVVVALGEFATSFFLPDNDLDMATLNGVPHYCTRKGLPSSLIVIPVTHPAAGLHAPKKSAETWLGLRSVSRFIHKDKKAPKVWVEGTPDVDIYLWEPKTSQVCNAPVALDTEGHKTAPWGLSLCGIGSEEALVVLEKDAGLLSFPTTIYLHNAKHDIPVLRRLGVTLPHFEKWEDTMLMGNATSEHPYNLKSLAYRFLHARMNHFDTLVAPHLMKEARSVLTELAARVFPAPTPYLEFDQKTKKFKEVNPQALHTRAWAAVNRLKKGQGDPIEWLGNLSPEDKQHITEAGLGPVPTMWNAINYVPLSDAVQYAGLDAWATARLAPILASELGDLDRLGSYLTTKALNPSLVEMEENGLPFSIERAEEIDTDFEKEEGKALTVVKRAAKDSTLNPRSNPQVSTVLTNLGATGRRVTMTGNESTDDRTLEELRVNPKTPKDLIVFLDALQDYRGWTKLRSTYTKALPTFVHEGVIYPHLSVTTAVSGRFSSEDPNLQNIPSRNEAGMKIRSCFRVPNDGLMLLSVDLSQIELRMGAHLSGDVGMIEAFKTGVDLHEKTRKFIFRSHPKVDDPDYNETLRKPAKTANFSIFYGITPKGLYTRFLQMGIREFSVDDCEKIIKDWFVLYPGAREFLDRAGEEAKRNGFVSTEGGKARFLPMARMVEFPSVEAEAIRQAGNHKIQGSAGELLQRSLHRWSAVDRAACNRITETRLILQIHDELLFLVQAMGPEDPRFIAVAKIIKKCLEFESGAYKVPIIAECKAGRSWGDMKKLKI